MKYINFCLNIAFQIKIRKIKDFINACFNWVNINLVLKVKKPDLVPTFLKLREKS